MTSPENWFYAISVLLIAIGFCVLVFFLCKALCALSRSLKQTEEVLVQTKDITEDVNQKLHCLDHLFHVAAKAGETAEKCTAECFSRMCSACGVEHGKMDKSCCSSCSCSCSCPCCQGGHGKVDKRYQTVLDVLEWALSGVGVWQKYKARR